jgi:WhiB family transcriptional regulator, redox-sensing transcriptional regulator
MSFGAEVPDSCRMFWLDVGETLVPSQRSAVEHNAGMVAGDRYRRRCRLLPWTDSREQPTGEVGCLTRARMPRPHEVAAARRDPRLLRAMHERDEELTWRVRGVCQSVDPEVFFPAPSEPADAAVALCRTCDVQGACLAWALEVGDCHGVWGATTPRERRAMLVAWHSDEVQTQLAEATTRPVMLPTPRLRVRELATAG